MKARHASLLTSPNGYSEDCCSLVGFAGTEVADVEGLEPSPKNFRGFPVDIFLWGLSSFGFLPESGFSEGVLEVDIREFKKFRPFVNDEGFSPDLLFRLCSALPVVVAADASVSPVFSVPVAVLVFDLSESKNPSM